jgi:hypothetical protein
MYCLKHSGGAAALLSILIAGWFSASSATGATAEQVDKAIEKAKAYLYTQQKNGIWENVPAPAFKNNTDYASVDAGQWGGITAVSTYALLAAGNKHNDPRLMPAIQFLLNSKIVGIYAKGMQVQIFNYMPSTKETRDAAKREAGLLIGALGTKGNIAGFYSYVVDPTSDGWYHHSPSQYGVLGVWACSQMGIEVPTAYWRSVDKGWRSTQWPDGGWGYQLKAGPQNPEKASMTAAGVATLFITADNLDPGGNGSAADAAIDKGLGWMTQHFNEVADLYAWYGVERIGTASGYKYFGKLDWYKAGADMLVKSQGPDGQWNGEWGPVVDTSLGLLFLARGRAPVVMNKLQFNAAGKPANWNARRRDAANLTRWMGRQMERDLNWQIVNLEVPVEELHDAPILYLSGDKALAFSPEDQDRLRLFVEQGGMILGNANNSSEEFGKSFQKLGAALFHMYEFRELPADHLIYAGEEYPRSKWARKPGILSLSNGVREIMMLLANGDPAKNWQLRNEVIKPESFQLMSDIFLYATENQSPRAKGDSYIETPDPGINTTSSLRVARLKYPGNWDPEPGGWRRLAAVLHNQEKIALDIQTVALGDGTLTGHPTTTAPGTSSEPFKVAHLTGTVRFSLTPAQVAEIKAYVTGGGTLIVDAAGGSTDFQLSAESMLHSTFGSDIASIETELSPDDPLYQVPDLAPANIHYRPFAQRVLGKLAVLPHLRGIRIDGRLAVIYSREDLTEGLVGEPIDGVLGYTPATATSLVKRLLLNALEGGR